MVCPKCGAENDCRGRYCLNCGWDLDYVPPKKNKGKLIGIIINSCRYSYRCCGSCGVSPARAGKDLCYR